MTDKIMWRVEFFANSNDEDPERSIFINADTEDEAAEKARGQMGSSMRANLTRVRTILPRPK